MVLQSPEAKTIEKMFSHSGFKKHNVSIEKKLRFPMISNAGFKNIVFSFVFLTGNTDFGQISIKSDTKRYHPILPDWGAFKKSVRKIRN